MENQNASTEDNLGHQLEGFFKNNPWSSLQESGDQYRIIDPWDDESLRLAIDETDSDLIDSLNHLILPFPFTALYHIDRCELEFIYMVVKETDPLWSRKFDFLFRGNYYICQYRESSPRLLNIARSFVDDSGEQQESRNLRMFKYYCLSDKADDYLHDFFANRKPMSFFISPINYSDPEVVIDLARNLNFYMDFIDRETPEIIIHQPIEKENVSVVPVVHLQNEFPKTLNGYPIDPFLLDLCDGAKNTSDRMAYIYFYQMLEYVAFYYKEDKVKTEIEKILRNPEVFSNSDFCISLIIDKLVDNKLSDEDKINAVVNRYVKPERIWATIAKYKAFFSETQTFDGGFILEPLVKDTCSVEDYKGTWYPKLPNTLRKIRNGLVHSRECHSGFAIAPTRGNSVKIHPWTKLIQEVASQVAMYKDI